MSHCLTKPKQTVHHKNVTQMQKFHNPQNIEIHKQLKQLETRFKTFQKQNKMENLFDIILQSLVLWFENIDTLF